jgi:alkylated DNA repair dioxygenase AlkB
MGRQMNMDLNASTKFIEVAGNKSIHHFDLPDADVTFYENFFSESESTHFLKYLTDNILWQQHQIHLFGKSIAQPRLTSLYGNKSYSYSGLSMKPHPYTETLLLIKNRIQDITEQDFTSVLLNLYRNGKDSVSWHSDDEKELGTNPVIASVSFGATRQFQLRHKTLKTKETIEFKGGSLLIMGGKTQECWENSIPKTDDEVGIRVNLTFRTII